jgi:hypothetical protein
MNMSEKKETKKTINLDLIRKLVDELENSLTKANEIMEVRGDVQDYIVECSKATGLAAGVMQESTFLISDIQLMLRTNTQSGLQLKKGSIESLEDILGGLLPKATSKLPGGSRGSN